MKIKPVRSDACGKLAGQIAVDRTEAIWKRLYNVISKLFKEKIV